MNWDKIVLDFKNGESISKLSSKYNMPYYTINNYLIKNNFKTIKHNKISNDIIIQTINMIKDGCIMNEIETKLSLDRSTIRNIAYENDLKISVWKPSRDIKNIDFNDKYFEKIDKEEKAYFLGLIYSDGNVREHNGGYYLSIELKREDKYILEKLATELKCKNKIYDRDRKTNFGESHMSNFTSCNSKKIFDDLARFNIVPDKSHTTTSFINIEELIPNNLIKHFLRGLIDGDGTISKRYTTRQNAIAIYQNEINFCYEFDRLLKKSMNDYNLYENIIVNKNTGVYNLRYRRIDDIKKICDFLYNGSSIYLKRKYQLAELYFKESQNNDSLLLCSNE